MFLISWRMRRSCRLRLKCDGTRAETRFGHSAKRTSPFKWAGASVQLTTGSRGVRISGSNAGYTMFQGSVKGTGYPLHSPVSPPLPLPCVTVCHQVSAGLYCCVLYVIGSRCSLQYTAAGGWRTKSKHVVDGRLLIMLCLDLFLYRFINSISKHNGYALLKNCSNLLLCALKVLFVLVTSQVSGWGEEGARELYHPSFAKRCVCHQ
jgi:hypothetical protein